MIRCGTEEMAADSIGVGADCETQLQSGAGWRSGGDRPQEGDLASERFADRVACERLTWGRQKVGKPGDLGDPDMPTAPAFCDWGGGAPGSRHAAYEAMLSTVSIT
ncbi:MAG TPA: hypothetical protein VK988_18820 [Acidimicrobiales bacterium]|nr:hypothetical protein [Acidimicrobiales bacterium]